MRIEDFDFHLPEELIAQAPAERRDASRLLHVDKRTGKFEHHSFADFISFIRAGDCLVFNDSKVIPARLVGKKAKSGGRAELLLIRPAADVRTDVALAAASSSFEWFCLGQASKGMKAGTELEFQGDLRALIVEALGGGEYRVRFSSVEQLDSALNSAGQLPLPPYIHRAPEAADADRYQTIYADRKGSVAAPTAGLHFTQSLLEQIRGKGVDTVFLTLEVGPGTFMPVRDGDLANHKMHLERYFVSEEAAGAIEKAKREGRRVIAVGTTVVRTLEAMAATGGVRSGPGETQIFISPGFKFNVVDAMLTNFHLPKSTLLMLVSAFLGTEKTRSVYEEAVQQKYRFFSYGDAVFIEDFQ